MLDRLLDRGKTSGRNDDNVDSIKKRFATYRESTMPIVDHFRRQVKSVRLIALGRQRKSTPTSRSSSKSIQERQWNMQEGGKVVK